MLTEDEVKMAYFSMHPDKAPGSDGLNPAFYQRFWDVVGKQVFEECRDWWQNGVISEEVRARMSDLRPISLCNVWYRIMAKVLANRLRMVMHEIIPEEQSAFIKVQSIIDNVLVVFETIQAMQNRRRAKCGEVAFKVDISKAYDIVEWSCLEAILTKIGFYRKWVD
ncbi:Transposon TX1 uncharacterized 149 kDa protein [Linum perenne]